MKIALPSKGTVIDDHFGHCDHFTVFTLNENKEIIHEEKIQSPAGCGCKSNIAGTLAQLGVKVMLAGNMGGGAVNVLAANGIEVVRGCSGDIRSTVERWIDGALTDSGKGCSNHGHECVH